MLRGTIFSVSRDYPKEIVEARRRLTPRFKSQRENRNNKASIEYAAKLIVNGKVIADEFADWYPALERDRCHLASNINSILSSRPSETEFQRSPGNSRNSCNIQVEVINIPAKPAAQCESENRVAPAQAQQTRSYSQVVSSGARQQLGIGTTAVTTCVNIRTTNTTTNTPTLITNVPRYAPTRAGNQTPQRTTTTFGSNTTNTTRCVQSDNNAGDNGIAARDQPTYLQL